MAAMAMLLLLLLFFLLPLLANMYRYRYRYMQCVSAHEAFATFAAILLHAITAVVAFYRNSFTLICFCILFL